MLAGGIGDARVEHIEQREVETVFDFRNFLEGERGFVELAVGDAIIDDARDEEVESFGSGLAEGARGGFESVGKGDDRAFFELGARTVVAETRFDDGRLEMRQIGVGNLWVSRGNFGGGRARRRSESCARLVDGELIKIANQARAVVLTDDVNDGAREIVLACEVHAVRDVLFDDASGFGGIAGVVGVNAVALVFGEVGGLGGFSDVVEQGADAGEEGIGADGVAGVFGELGDDEGVVIRAGRIELHAAEERVIVVGELEECNVRGAFEEGFENGEEADDGDAGEEAGGTGGSHLTGEGFVGDLVGVADKGREGGDGEAAGTGGADDATAAAGITAEVDGDEGGEEGEDEEIEAVTVDDAGEN